MLNPISVNQIQDTNLDLKCIPPPTCRTLPNDAQAIVDFVCSKVFDQTKVNKGTCVTGTTIEEILTSIISKVQCLPDTTPIVDLSTINISGLNFCTSDNWAITDNNCLTLVDACGVPLTEFTTVNVLQVLIRRIIALENILKTQNTTINTLQTDLNTLEARVTLIETSCCNVSLVTQIGALGARTTATENRLTAGGL